MGSQDLTSTCPCQAPPPPPASWSRKSGTGSRESRPGQDRKRGARVPEGAQEAGQGLLPSGLCPRACDSPPRLPLVGSLAPAGPRPQLLCRSDRGPGSPSAVPAGSAAVPAQAAQGGRQARTPRPPHHAACSRVLGTAPVPRKWPSAVLGRPPRGLPGSGGTVGHVSRPSVAVQGSGGWGADPEPPGSEPSAPRAGQSPRGQPRAGSSANGPRCRTTPRRGCNHSRPRGGGWAPARQWRPERWWEGQLRAAPRLADHRERQEVLARG